MADETRIDPDGARRLFRAAGETGDKLEAALRRVETIRSTLPEPWGTDEYGQRFSQKHGPKSADALRDLGDTIRYLRDLKTEGTGVVDEFEALDTDNAANIAPKS